MTDAKCIVDAYLGAGQRTKSRLTWRTKATGWRTRMWKRKKT